MCGGCGFSFLLIHLSAYMSLAQDWKVVRKVLGLIIRLLGIYIRHACLYKIFALVNMYDMCCHIDLLIVYRHGLRKGQSHRISVCRFPIRIFLLYGYDICIKSQHSRLLFIKNLKQIWHSKHILRHYFIYMYLFVAIVCGGFKIQLYM